MDADHDQVDAAGCRNLQHPFVRPAVQHPHRRLTPVAGWRRHQCFELGERLILAIHMVFGEIEAGERRRLTVGWPFDDMEEMQIGFGFLSNRQREVQGARR